MTAVASPDRRVPLFVLLASVASLGVALASQYWGGLVPCILCIYQRYPYGVAAVLGLIGILVAARPALLRLILVLAGVVFLVDAGIAFYHVGVEQHWWAGTAQCESALPTGLSADELEQLLQATPVTRCDHPAWSMFGVSMAGYNFLYATLCGLATLWAAARRR
jgi:disulfide bond formation protein DsbB